MVEHRASVVRWRIWMAAIAICGGTLVALQLGLSRFPLMAPPLCAVMIGWQLPPRHFLSLSVLSAIVMLAPDPTVEASDDFRMNRIVALICLAALVVIRMRSAGGGRFRMLTGQPVWAPVVGAIPRVEMSAAETMIPQTVHRQVKDDNVDYSMSGEIGNNEVSQAIARLKQNGSFDDRQLQLIELELRSMDANNLGIAYGAKLEPGVQIGRFVIVESLGRGGEGTVYRGSDTNGEPAAIKILHNLYASDRFRREMHVVRMLAHPNIVTAYEVGEFRRVPYIAMEWLRGPDLQALVRDSGPLDWRRATQYCLQTAMALAHAHDRDLLHRDVKPGNLILNGDDSVKVVDFGLAALKRQETSVDSIFRFETNKGHVAGTLPYMPPEQARSLANATVRSDVYALGATWFYLLTGKVRLGGSTFPQQFENLLVHRRFNRLPKGCLPAPLESIFRRMVSYDAGDRYNDCTELALQIVRALKRVGELPLTQNVDVLIVEDSRTDMVFTIKMLRLANSAINIREAQTLLDGVSVCLGTSIDLVLLDLTLPDSTGVQTVQKFRDAAPNVPLVVLTGVTDDGIGAECLAAGADAFLPKNSLTPHRVERTVFVTLSRRRRGYGPLSDGADSPEGDGEA